MGLANVLAAVQAGITRFDGSLGGLGGCPYAPGASGNICSEDAIHMLQAMGYGTGVDLQPRDDFAALVEIAPIPEHDRARRSRSRGARAAARSAPPSRRAG